MSRQNVEDLYTLSPLQQGLFFHTLYAPQSGVYVEQLDCTLRGELHLTAFEHAWQQVLDRHPILRTAFLWKELEEPVQVVRQRVKLSFHREDWRSLTKAQQEERLDQYLKTDRSRGFDLSKAPLMRLALIHLSEDEHQFIWTYHHLILDGWCIPIVMNEVFAFYEATSRGQTVSLERTRPYRDYIAWLKRQDLTKAETFWRETLKGFSAPTPVPVEKIGVTPARESDSREDFDQRSISLPQDMTLELVALARQYQLTLNTLVQGAWAVLLNRYSGEQEVVFGITVSGRPAELAGVESMVGLFINTLPLRVSVDAQDSLLPWLRMLQEQQIELRQYEYSPLVQVQGWSEVPRGQALFESLLVFENYPVDASLMQRLRSLSVSNLRKIERTNYPLTLLAVPGAELALQISYDPSRFDSAAILRMLGHLQRLLEGTIADPHQRLSQIPLLTEDERTQLLEVWNETGVDYPRGVCLHELFEEQAKRTPDSVALSFEEQHLSYLELNRRANCLAHHLQACGVKAETLVGVLMERSIEMVVGLLGILKAGGVYVPLDPEYPRERLRFMIEDARVGVLLTQERFGELVQELSGRSLEVLYLDMDQWMKSGEKTELELAKNPLSGVRGENLAYLIYTSGSTGRPKGVMNRHGGISNRLQWMQEAYGLRESDRVMQKTPYSFDVSVWELFWPLIVGARLVMARPKGHQDPAYLVRLIAQEQITTLHFVPSMLQVFLSEDGLENCRSLRRVMCSGEALSYELQEKFFAHMDASLHNLYGPTEAAVDVTHWTCERESERHLVPIGRPIANTQLYILDQYLRPVPVGVAGELHLGGIGLARGYLDRPELTAEKFIPHPFSRKPGARLYRTGDRARYLSDGAVEYLGRLDYQVKVRGFRIELGEIESILVQHVSIRESVVLVREDFPGEPRIVAYVVHEKGAAPPAWELRGFLKERLPEYMMPAAFVELPALPLTPNGKIDRGALPVPESSVATGDDDFAAPSNPLEEVVAGIWAEVLRLERVSSQDNFFELGGHSLLAVKIISRLRTIMRLDVPVRELFEAPTVNAFTKRIEALQRDAAGLPTLPLLPFDRDGELPLSFAQQRLWFLDQLEPESAVYNIPAAVRLSGALDIAALEQSFDEVMRRHEVLRATFKTMHGQPQQLIAPVQTLKLRLVDLKHTTDEERENEAHRIAAEEAQRAFNLAQGPLLRTTLLRLSDSEHVLLLTMHHIISDGWSIEVLLQEMAALYEAFSKGQASPLAELPLQYVDFAYWQRRWLQGEVLEKQLAYWKKQLGGALSKLELPTKRDKLVQSDSPAHKSASYSFALSGPLSGALKSLGQREGVTLFMTLLAAFKTLLYRYTGQADIVVGTPVANRNRTEIEKLIGFFVNVLVLRTDLSGNPTFRELLARVREVVLGAYAHQDLPFEKLVLELPSARSASRMPLHQVAFVFQHHPLSSLTLSELTLKPTGIVSQTAKNDLVLFVNETEHGLAGLVQYDSDLFEAETIERMFRHFAELLETLAAEPGQRLKNIELFREEMALELAIPASRIERIAPLTPTQRDLYLAHLIDPDITVYSDGVSVNLGPNLDVAAWRQAVELVCETEEVTRTRFFMYRGEAFQFVEQSSPAGFEFVDLLNTPFDAANLEKSIRERVKIKYDLDSGPLLNNLLLRDGGGQYVAVVAWYHILFDAYSLKLFLETVISAYQALVAGREPARVERASFYDYTGDCLARFDSQEAYHYWSNKLSDVSSPLEFSGRLSKRAESVSQRRAIAPAQLEEIRAFCQANKCSMPAYFRALYGILLSKYLDSADNFVVYDVVGGRPKTHGKTLGCFYQVVPTLFTKELCEAHSSVGEWLEHARNYRTSLGPMQDISVFLQKRIVKDGRLKFFYNYYNFSTLEVDGERKIITHYKSFSDDEVHFIVDDLQDGIELVLHYHERHFHDARVLERILSLSEQITAGTTQLRDLDVILADERRRLLLDWNETRADYRQGVTLQQLFEEQAKRTPDSVALSFEEQHLSYLELNRRANCLAHHLQACGVKAETLVGVLMERSIEMVVGLLGILKAGGVYVPLDPEYPRERLRFMIEDARVRVIVAQAHLLALIPEHEAVLVCLDRDWAEIAGQGGEPVECEVGAENLAYLIYTSGSTGRPKGVMNRHGGISNRLQWMQEAYRLRESDRVMQKTPYSFDVSVWELFWPLIVGARLVMARPKGHQDPAYLVRLIQDQKITVMHFVPAMLNVFLSQPGVEKCRSLRAVMCSGEALPFELQERFFALLPAELHNLYGPTEASVDVTSWACQRSSDERVVPIGRPIANTQIYLLGRELQLVPVGAAGELYIGGYGLARGYLARPGLTAEKFVPAPFGGRPGARLYRTGDLARYLPDGVIEYLGRTDYQVKVRGFRIELGEIEAALREHPAINEAVVLASDDEHATLRLAAYYTVANGKNGPVKSDLRGYLKERLPEYMMPAAFVELEALPLTSNGKIDRRALPALEIINRATDERVMLAARTPTEARLSSIWCDVLGLERVSVDDNFFELGGHSLLATQVISRVRETFEVELPLRSMFESPTVASLALRVDLAISMEQGQRFDAIMPVSRQGELPLSFAQQRLWFLDQLEPGSPFYNIPSAVRLNGPLDVPVLERSLNEVVRRHEVLRTTFTVSEGQPRQIIAPELRLSLPLLDLQNLAPTEQEAEGRRLATDEAQRPFDLASGPLMRGSLLRLDEQEYVLLLTMHHIISDGWSMALLLREVTLLYQAFSKGEASPLAELPIQYADFAHWQRQWLQGAELEEQLAYWKRQLDGSPPLLELPTDRPRPAMQGYRGATHSFILPAQLSSALHALSQSEGVTLFMTLLAAFKTLLYRYTGQADIVVGSPIANRRRAEIEGLIGFFVNTLALRTDLSAGPTFLQLLRRLREVTLGAYEHQDLPFEKLVLELQPARDLSYSPLFQVMFDLQSPLRALLDLPGIMLEPLEIESGVAKFDLGLSMTETEGGLRGTWEYNTDLFDDSTIRRMTEHLRTLLQGIVLDPAQSLDALPLLTEEERHQLLSEWNETRASYPQDVCLHGLFEAQAKRSPGALAIVFGEQQLTYLELDQRANQLAHYLRRLGVGPDVPVGICVERSVEFALGMLGILKAGGAYVPLDPAYPGERLAYILKDTRSPLLLTQAKLVESLTGIAAQIICLDSEWEKIALEDVGKPACEVMADNLAIVIYTSGSTGRPKGVMLNHRGLSNRFFWGQDFYRLDEADRVLQLFSYSFDFSAWEFFTAFVAGARLIMTEPGGSQDSAYLTKLIQTHAVTVAGFTPSMLDVLLSKPEFERYRSLKKVLCGGEAMPVELQERFFSRFDAELQNTYGPTEASIDVTCRVCRPEHHQRAVPIGRPIANTRIYLLDANSQPVPVGVPGELYIGGTSLARGYLDQPELTAQKFIPNTFGEESGARLYRTGDLARYRADGQIEFLGRLDAQVKIRGFRIELGEIETVLAQHPAIQEALVQALEDSPGSKRLVAYVVVAGDSHISTGESREFLRQKLPEYMLPSVFVSLPEMPLTPNGKIDRRALPAPERLRPELSERFVAPRNPIEEMLASIWSEVLELDGVGVDDNFFELGGHSLLATQVISRVRAVFRVDIPLRHLFEAPTLSGLARKIEKTMGQEQELPSVPLAPAPRDVDLPLSFVQQRFWFLQQLMPESSAYNISTAIRLTGALDVQAFERSFKEIVRRHEILRTTFPTIEGNPVQVINSGLDFSLPLLDLSRMSQPQRESEARRIALEEARRPFDLARGPLLRVHLLRLETDDHILVLNLHHIVSDGWSTGVLIRELTAIYEAFQKGQPSPLPELPIQYADFAYWQREWLKGEVLESRLAYWKREFGNRLPVLNLQTDRPRPPVQTSQGSSQFLVLPEGLAAQVRALGQRESVTLFMLLLAAFQVLLYRYTEQSDIAVGSSIANRNHVETENLIGLLINTLVLRTDLSGEPTFLELLSRVREVTLGAYAHQDLPLEQLLEELRGEWATSRAPLFQVAFQLQNFSLPSMKLAGLTLSPLEVLSETAKFDLSMSMMETADGLTGTLEYSTDLFDAETIRRMLDHFRTLLENIVAGPEQRISEFSLIGEDERRQLLVQSNYSETDHSRGECLHELFAQQALRTPDAVALVFEEQQVSYRELNGRANQLAHYLRGLGVGPETLVGICVERSIEMVLGLLGILKAGGAYVPLDPAYPSERLAYMLSDTGLTVLLTQGELLETLPVHDARVVCLDADWQIISRESQTNPCSGVMPDNPAYIIYTSGSTGKPKGTLVSHRSVFHLFAATQQSYHFDERDVWTLFHSYAFDFSVWELWGALAYGGRLVVVPYWVSRSPEAFYKLLCTERVTVLNQTPSAFRQLMRVEESDSDAHDLSMRLVIFGGEALELQSLRPWFSRHGDLRPRLFNMYGITETTVHVTYRALSKEDVELASGSLIGRPIPCLGVYILDQHQGLVPIGVPGEICVGGTGLARGYYRRAGLTAERFIPNPFSREPGARLYRSGDLARYLPGGEIEYLGRIDHQVKIRGYRIELGEIEAALSEHPSVQECVVVATEDSTAEKRLMAYVVLNRQAGPLMTELRDFLQHQLPEHMVPNAFVFLDALPLTPNGKVDRRALPAPDRSRPELSGEFVAPRSPVEMELAEIWQQLLGVERVGIHDNFFELGGHSLLLTQLASWIRKAFQVEVPLRVLFDTPTIIEMTKAILARQVEQESRTDLAQMLKQLKQLSPHEVKSMLEKMGNS
jgi:amino acid adenylation domain-containing protein